LESLSDFVTRNSLNDGNPAINIGYRPRFRKLVDLECDIIEQTHEDIIVDRTLSKACGQECDIIEQAHEDLSGLLL
jgi:hypothetical protein